tara:strand:+ start:67 stop:432 length:366 start_codon:yes stop_codon:yes gene_type:complete
MKKSFWEGNTDFGSNSEVNKKFAKKWFVRFLCSLIFITIIIISIPIPIPEIHPLINGIVGIFLVVLGLFTFFSFMVLISHLLILKQEHARWSLRNKIVNYIYTILFFAILFGLWFFLFDIL